MQLSQVALQLYTLREHCQTAATFAASAAKVRAIGYTAVQISGAGPIPESELVSICRNEGLTICATHEPGAQILDQTDLVIERLQKLGCTRTAYPYPAGIDFTNGEAVETLVRKLDIAGAKLRQAGMTLGYHNHGIEFVKYKGTPVLDYIFAATQPDNLVGEIDTFWIHYGGGDVVEWCQKLRGRMPFIHIKDYGFTKENKHTFCEIGAGTLNFRRIIAEAEKSGCEWFIVEQDTTPGDPFVSIKQSYDYIHANLVS